MTRQTVVDAAAAHVDTGRFLEVLRRRVAYRTDSRQPDNPELRRYLAEELAPATEALGCTARVVDNPVEGAGPLLVARRDEDPALPTVLVYGHADVVPAQEERWSAGLDPWGVTVRDGRWYGRGTADNKGQHTVNLLALEEVLRARGRLGFNLVVLVETGEEVGSPGLREACRQLEEDLAADVLIASDGPRNAADSPTLFLGSRGMALFTLSAERDGSHHSGNWGGLLRNPATRVAAAVASLVSADGRILVEGLRPPPIPDAVRRVLADVTVGGGPGDPAVDDGWGEPGLTPAERVLGWNTLEVLAMTGGTPEQPVGAIPASARAHCQLRFVVGTRWTELAALVREHLDAAGLSDVQVSTDVGEAATRLDPEDPWVTWATDSVRRTTGRAPTLLPNLGGTLPNDVFATDLGLPTLWVPHSHPACSQHAPDEHLLPSVAREGLQVMAGLFWDLGELEDGIRPTIRSPRPPGAGAA
jgi:acetylornithine deacetylase/succinyl-diaminopimelate desuccinylase-like protein